MKNKKGFTLIEALAVLVILSLLITFSVVSVSKIKKKQEIENRINVIRSILTAARAYEADHPDTYPSSGLPVSTLLRENYVDFDTNKYSDYYNNCIRWKTEDNGKREFYFDEVLEINTSHNIRVSDCGLEYSQNSSDVVKKICAFNSVTEGISNGWDKDGKYIDTDGKRNSAKDFE